MNNYNELFDQITNKLTELFKIPESGSMTIGVSRIKSFIEKAKGCFEYDPTGFTSISMLEENWKLQIKQVTFSFEDLLNNDPELLCFQKTGLEIGKLLDDATYNDEKEYFVSVVRDGLKHYGSDKEFTVSEILNSRYCSLNSYKNLNVNQFLKGEYSAAPPSYIKQIYEWWNINSLLKFAVTLPNSVSMHLIRNPNLFEMYFCFVIKNGANIYIMTDKGNHDNPLYHQMTRRPDRDLAKKIEGHCFPYYLMDIGAEDGQLFSLEKEDLGNALAPYQKDTKIIETVDQLEADSLVWTILMFNLIQQNFFLNKVDLPVLSYTAEMIKKPDILINHAKNNGLVLYQDTKQFVQNTVGSVSTENVDRDALGSEVQTNWIEQRYGHLVNEEALNIIAAVEDNYELKTEDNVLVLNPNESFREDTHIKLSKISTSDFGDAEQLEKNHIFIARKNYVSIIEDMADKEFQREQKSMDKWFKDLVDAKNDLVMAACKAVKDSYKLIKDSNGNLTYERKTIQTGENGDRENVVPITFNSIDISRIARLDVKEAVSQNFLGWWPKVYIGTQATKYGDYECCLSGKKAHFGIGFKFRTIDELIGFFGISIDEVPEFLRYFDSRNNRSATNYILNRVDPMANINNPFARHGYKLSILVLFSKSELKKFA